LNNPSPDTVLDSLDPGDDVIARFRYQFCNVAINALRLISNPAWAKSVICENFEDLILERHDGTFVAIQVKTRARNLSLFKLTDLAVQKSLIRFVRLDLQFPEKFTEFRFTTNHGLWCERDDHDNFDWLLSQLRAIPTIKRLRKDNPKRKAVVRLSDESGATTEQVISVLLRTKTNSRGEDVRSIERSVEHAVVECDSCKDLQHHAVVLLAEDLISAASIASTKGSGTLASQLYAADADFASVFSEMSLLGKKLDRSNVEKIIGERLIPTDEPLSIGDVVTLEDLPSGLSKMVQKMAAGGVQTSRINHTLDLVRSFEALQVKWALKYGPVNAKIMVNDLLARTLTDCIEAHVATESESTKYGPQQFTLLKQMLDDRYVREKDTLYGCKPDHLIGAAGALTEACKVWWSKRFELLDETS